MTTDGETWAIDARGLTKTFGTVTAGRGVTLQVPSGSIFAFLGPNGSGKSTTVKLLTGLLAPTAGEARVTGRVVSVEDLELRREIGILPEDDALFPDLTIWEHLELCGRLYGLDRQETDARAIQLLRHLDLEQGRTTLVEKASFGITIVSLLGLSPLLSARHPLLGSLAALFFFALTIGVGMTVSQPLGLARWRRSLFVAVAALGAVAVALALASVHHGARPPLSASLRAANPATLVTTVAVATTPYAMAVPLATLVVSGAAVWYLLLWSFLRSLQGGTSERTAHRATSIARLPGRLGPLVRKEQRSVTTVLDLWMGLLLVLAAAALSPSASLSSTFRQTVFVIVCALNANVTLNCLGLDRPAGLTRYLILPIHGKDLLLAKNVAVMLVVAVQLLLLLAIGAWQSGFTQVGAEIVVAIVLIVAHLAGATSSRCSSHADRSRTGSRLLAIL